jgi:HAE1 family hydrophobic/amphiphilic exporter-1
MRETTPRTEQGILHLVTSRPVAVLMAVLAVATFGLVSLSKLPVTLLPEISYPTLTVRTEYPGSAPSEVEKLVTTRMEENLSVVPRLVSSRSMSRAGVSDVILEFQWKTPMAFATQDVREKVDQLRAFLPEGVGQPLILRYDPTLDPVMRLALYWREQAPGEGDFEIRRIAEEELKRSLESLTGVAAVRVMGGLEEEWRVELSEERLLDRGVGLREVADRIALENANVAGGILRDGDRESLVRTLGELQSLTELGDLSVSEKGGEPILVRELGTVTRAAKERDIITRVGGRESVEIEIYKEADANIVALAQAVKTRLFGANHKTALKDGTFVGPSPGQTVKTGSKPTRANSGGGGTRLLETSSEPIATILLQQGLGMTLLQDQSIFIEASIRDVRNSALLGAGLAIIVLFAFLRRLSPTLIISVAIPISVVATFAPLYLNGVTLNIMSLGGLALGVGMLVDSAIVVLESITKCREQKDSPRNAAITGTRRVGLAVLASTLTTVAVFLPMVFVDGIAGEFFRDQALAVVFSLLASLLAALLFIPMLASRDFTMGSAERMGWQDLFPPSPRKWMSFPRKSSERGWKARWAYWLQLPFNLAIRFPLELLARTSALILFAIAIAGRWVLLALSRALGLLLYPPLALFDLLWRGLARAYDESLRVSLKNRLLLILAALAMVALTWPIAARLGVELIPRVHQGAFTVETAFDVGTPVATTDEKSVLIGEAIARALQREDIALSVTATSAGIKRDQAAKPGEGSHTSKVLVRLSATGNLRELEERAIRAIRGELALIPGLKAPVITRPSLFTTRTSLEVEVLGRDLKEIDSKSLLVEDLMRSLPGLRDLQTTRGTGYPEVVVEPHRERLTFYGVNAETLAVLIRDKVQGSISTRISVGDRKIDVLVRSARKDVDGRDRLKHLRMPTPSGESVPLMELASIEERPGPAEIRHVGGERAVILSADVENLDLRGAARRVMQGVENLRLKDPNALSGVTVRLGGQQEESERSLRSLLFAGLIAIFLVYIVMASQFESLVHPLIILCTIPLALVGVLWALQALSIKISIVVLLGAILLAGIVVNNAIVLVDAINQLRREGKDRDDAIRLAGSERLRPIFMTTLTTILGLLPLALGLGEGAEIRIPMAITVIAGLISSTFLTLFIIPVVYSLLSSSGPLRSLRAIEEAPQT